MPPFLIPSLAGPSAARRPRPRGWCVADTQYVSSRLGWPSRNYLPRLTPEIADIEIRDGTTTMVTLDFYESPTQTTSMFSLVPGDDY